MTTRRSFLKAFAGIAASIALAQQTVIGTLRIETNLSEQKRTIEAFQEDLMNNATYINKERMRSEYQRLCSFSLLVNPA